MSKFKEGGGITNLIFKKKIIQERHLISHKKEIIGALCFNKKKKKKLHFLMFGIVGKIQFNRKHFQLKTKKGW